MDLCVYFLFLTVTVFSSPFWGLVHAVPVPIHLCASITQLSSSLNTPTTILSTSTQNHATEQAERSTGSILDKTDNTRVHTATDSSQPIPINQLASNRVLLAPASSNVLLATTTSHSHFSQDESIVSRLLSVEELSVSELNRLITHSSFDYEASPTVVSMYQQPTTSIVLIYYPNGSNTPSRSLADITSPSSSVTFILNTSSATPSREKLEKALIWILVLSVILITVLVIVLWLKCRGRRSPSVYSLNTTSGNQPPQSVGSPPPVQVHQLASAGPYQCSSPARVPFNTPTCAWWMERSAETSSTDTESELIETPRSATIALPNLAQPTISTLSMVSTLPPPSKSSQNKKLAGDVLSHEEEDLAALYRLLASFN